MTSLTMITFLLAAPSFHPSATGTNIINTNLYGKGSSGVHVAKKMKISEKASAVVSTNAGIVLHLSLSFQCS